MKISRTLLLLPLLIANADSLLALDFTLHRKLAVADAIKVERTFIMDGPSKIYLQLPAKWVVADTARSLDFTPDRVPSSVRVEQVDGMKNLSLDEAGKVLLRQRMASASLPEATNIKTLSEKPDTLSILDWKSFEITQSYHLSGQNFRRGMLFLDLGAGRVLQMTISATDKDFDDIHADAFSLMSSWFEPSKDLPPALARAYEN